MTTRFNLILTGHVLAGHSRESAGKALAGLMGISTERAGRLVAGQETVVKRGLLARQTQKYLEAMRAAGAEARVVPEWSDVETIVVASHLTEIESSGAESGPVLAPASPPVEPPARPDAGLAAGMPGGRPQPAEKPVTAAAATFPRDPGLAGQGAAPTSTGLSLVVEETMECPACGAPQPKRTLCRECGADMPRVAAAKAEAEQEARAARAGGDRPAARAGGSPYAAPRSSVDEVAAVEGFETPHPLGLSLGGRVGRLRYLAYAFPAYLPAVVGGVLAGIMGGISGPSMGLIAPLALGGIISMWLAVRTMVLRLHDLNRSGKWVLFMLVIPIVAAISRSPGALVAFVVLMVIVSLLLIVLPGSTGSNDYGAPPGPNTLWTIIGAVLMLLLTLFSFVSDKGTSFSGIGSGDEELTAEEMEQLQEFQRQIQEMQRQSGGRQ